MLQKYTIMTIKKVTNYLKNLQYSQQQKTEMDRLLKFNTKVYNNMMKDQNNISKSTFRRSKKSKSYLKMRYNIDQKNINNYQKT